MAARTLPALALALLLTPIAAQGAQPEPTWRRFGLDRSLDWVHDPEVFVDGRRPKRSLTAEVDREPLLDAAVAKAKAEDKLVLWYVYRIVEKQSRGRQMYRAPVLDLYTMQVLFNDPEVVELVARHFVPIRLVCDEALSERFGLRPLGFVEPAIVFVGADGRAVHHIERIRTFSGHWFADVLRRVLRANAIPARPSRLGLPSASDQEVERLAGSLSDGGGLRSDPGALSGEAMLYLAGELRRRQRRAGLDEALRLVDGAARKGAAAADVLAERMRLLTLAGRSGDAVDAFESAVDEGATTAAEARYLYAQDLLALGRETAAREQLELTAARHADDMFGRRARANVEIGPDERPYGAAFAGFETVRWLPDAAYEGLPKDTAWSGPALDEQRMVEQAVRFLLRAQREHGGFTDCRYAYWPSPRITPNAWIAITALCATALYTHRDVDPKAVDAALARAERYMFDPKHLNRGQNEDVYADTYRLFYLARRGPRDPAARARIVERMNAIVQQSVERQQDSGFFAHEYANAFATSAMLWGARLAAAAGADVPNDLFDRGVAALLSARHENGAFVYGGAARRGGRQSSLKDSSARMPMCEGMLFAFGRSDPQKLQTAFDTFWGHMDRIEQVRRNDFHSDGELAGFFFFNAVFHASEVSRLLPPERHADNQKRFFELLQRIPEIDGSFIDSHELGRSYATAMALLIAANCEPE